MNYKDIINDIKNKNIKNIYLFYGKEYYLIEDAIKKLKSTLNDGMVDFNLDIIDGKETRLDELISSIETLPFMDDRKIVILKDFELLTGKKKNFTSKDEKYFIEYIDRIPASTTLVFIVYGDIDKDKKLDNNTEYDKNRENPLFKKIKKEAIVSNCSKLEGIDLLKWIKGKFNNKNVIIDNAQIMYFINSEGYLDKSSEKTLSDLENEINKISSFVGKENKVTNDIIDRLSQRKVENDIFKLIDYIGNKNSSYAIKILNDMLYEGESVFGIFAMIARQFRIIMQVRQLQTQGYTTNSIADRLKLHPFVVGKALKQTKKFSDEIIIDILNDILDSEFKIKNGLIRDTLSIEILISKYCKKEIKNLSIYY